jgi:HAD superfamily hydrolase (TIGR01509 family)
MLSGLPAAVLFDMDGLLIDTEGVSEATYRQTCLAHDAAVAADAYWQLIGRDQPEQRAIFKTLMPDYVDLARFDREWRQAFLQQLEHHVPLKPGAKDLCKWLSQHAVPMVVATSTLTDKAETLLQQAGLFSYLVGVVGGDQVERGKPAPDLYLAAAKLAGALPVSALAFEDTPQGVMAAHAAGVPVIQIPDMIPADEVSRAATMLVADSLHDAATRLGWMG